MASGWTNRGKYNTLMERFRAQSVPTNFYVALVTSAVSPAADINTFSQLTEIADTNGYTAGGISLTRNGTDFPTVTEDDGNDLAEVTIKDLVWTADGGNLPVSGNGARWAILTDDNVTLGDREVEAYWDLSADRTISDTQTLTLQACKLRLTEPA